MTQKSLDRNRRWRGVTAGFRMSPEENDLLNSLVAISGMTKQDYIIARLENREVTVVPSSRVEKNLLLEMRRVYQELRRIEEASEMPSELAELVVQLGKTFNGLGVEEGVSEVSRNDDLMRCLRRE
ncbi:MAG: hypothetical protein QM302_04155 [Acidobacteriota bacterium]|nr:hypothetical protein [Acidobacteriota bacterium]